MAVLIPYLIPCSQSRNYFLVDKKPAEDVNPHSITAKLIRDAVPIPVVDTEYESLHARHKINTVSRPWRVGGHTLGNASLTFQQYRR